MDAAPSTPSPTGTPAACRSRVRQMPAPSRALDEGQWATPVPESASARIAGSSRWMPCASHTSGPSQPRESTYSTGEQPNRSRQKASSSVVSARWVCSRTPLSRASAADCSSSSPVTENGEQGATPRRSIESGDGSWWRSTASDVASRIASISSTTWSGGSPPRLAPRSIAPRVGRKRSPTERAASISAAEQVAAVGGEHVVVVGRGRAAGARELHERPGRAGAQQLLVQARPHGVERGEPLEERVVDREAAGQPLVEVVVGVDQPRGGQAAGAVDVRRPGQVAGRRPGADRGDPVALDDHVAAGVLRAIGVHRRDRAALDHDRHRIRPAARCTASMIFS